MMRCDAPPNFVGSVLADTFQWLAVKTGQIYIGNLGGSRDIRLESGD